MIVRAVSGPVVMNYLKTNLDKTVCVSNPALGPSYVRVQRDQGTSASFIVLKSAGGADGGVIFNLVGVKLVESTALFTCFVCVCV